LHLQHTVAPKETWYSIGRIYNISPKEIAPLNTLTLDNPLNIGQQIKIPLTSTNFSQGGAKMADEVYVPLYHTVQDKEWMYRVSTNFNKVPVETLEKWNNIGNDQIKPGARLIVGYLKVKKDQSVLAQKGIENIQAGSAIAARTEEVKTAPVARQDNIPPPVVPPQESIKKGSPTADVVAAEEKAPPAKVVPVSVSGDVEGGYFKVLYEEAGKKSAGSAGVFKSTSGWQDRKYYALMNNIAVGTIVKVSNPSTNKIVYAKVLGQLPDMKESAGLTVRISDAAASELGASIPRFPVQIVY
jgi:LysM repeat protein